MKSKPETCPDEAPTSKHQNPKPGLVHPQQPEGCAFGLGSCGLSGFRVWRFFCTQCYLISFCSYRVGQVFGYSGVGHHLGDQQSWKVCVFVKTRSYCPSRLRWDVPVVRRNSYIQDSSTLHPVISSVEGLAVTLPNS